MVSKDPWLQLGYKYEDALKRWVASSHHDDEALADMFEAAVGARPKVGPCTACERGQGDGV